MLLKNLGQAQRYMEENTGDGGTGSAAVKEPEVKQEPVAQAVPDMKDVMNSPEVRAAIQSQIDSEVAGLKGKNSELLKKMKAASDQNKLYEGIDIDKYRSLEKKLEVNEEMRLLSEGKTDEVVALRVESIKRDHETEMTARDTRITNLESELTTYTEDLTKLVIDGHIREAYVGLDFEPSAMDDTIRSGRDVFKMGSDGKAIPRDANDNIIYGTDGKTPITAVAWLEGIAETKKYLRRESKGSGASGGGKSSGATDTSKMTNTQRIAHGLLNGGLS